MSKSNAAEIAANRGLGGGNFGRRGAPVEKPKSFKKTLVRLWAYFGTERKFLSITFLLVIIGSAIGLIIPYFIGVVVDRLNPEIGPIKLNLVHLILISLVVFYTTQAIITFIQGFMMAGISQRIVLRLRKALFDKLQTLPVSFFDKRSHGELMSRLTNDIDNISNTISQSTTQLMSLVITIVGSLVMMLILSPLLTIAAMVTIPLVFLVTKSVTKRTRILFKKQQAILGSLNGNIEENITGISVVRAFNNEKKVIDDFKVLNDHLCEVGMKANILSGLIMPLMNVINNLSFALVAGVGGILAPNGYITIGIIASFLSYSKQFGRPLNEIATTFNTLQTAVAGAERIFEILDEKEEIDDVKNAKALENVLGNIRFENVSFGYKEDELILKKVSFSVKQGMSVALVGPTGAGKTTIVNLLTRFYDVTSGKIMIDGNDIRAYTHESLRKSFGIVLQDTYLFSGTIKENILYGAPNATDDEVKLAAQKAYANLFIERLQDGYDTILSESGHNLSQGQRQLLAIARAILADAPILILDEATSSVDTRTELHIQEAMLELMKNRTSFIIAHRLSTIKDCDLIMVIDHGEIIEMGSHKDLVSIENGFYHNMYMSQLGKK